MRSARPRNEQAASRNGAHPNRQPASTQQSQPQRQHRRVNVRAVIHRILDIVVTVASIPVHFLEFFTGRKGSSIVFGILAIYMLLVNCEGYLQSWGGGQAVADFTWKPFVNEPQAIYNLLPTIAGNFLPFIASLVLSTAVQAVQAWGLRDITPDEAKTKFESVAHHKVPEHDPKSIDLAQHYRQQYKTAGTKEESGKGLLLLGVYAVDAIVAYRNFPFIGQATAAVIVVNFIWFWLSLGGSEIFLNAWRSARRASLAAAKQRPQVEVM